MSIRQFFIQELPQFFANQVPNRKNVYHNAHIICQISAFFYQLTRQICKTDATFNIVQLTPPNSYTYDARKKDYLTFMAMTNECLAVILMNDIKSSGFLL